jgi:hypothetical protein
VVQEPVMTPSVLTGSRKFLTAMDAAFLRDLGYSTIPEPASMGLLLAGVGLLLAHPWRRTGRSVADRPPHHLRKAASATVS